MSTYYSNTTVRVLRYIILLSAIFIIAIIWLKGKSPEASSSTAQIPPGLEIPNPFSLPETLEMEQMSSLDVRDCIKAGKTRVILPTGGFEQNGPFVSLRKHNLIAKAVSLKVAASLGNTLVAPTLNFSPAGDFDPPTGHMLYPGSISLGPELFQQVVESMASSLVVNGFTEVLIVGDSFESQNPMKLAAANVSKQFSPKAKVLYIPDFYNYELVRNFIKEQGFKEVPSPFHDELAFSLQLLAIEPHAIRYEDRLKINQANLGGIDISNKAKFAQLGEKIIELRAKVTVDAYNKLINN